MSRIGAAYAIIIIVAMMGMNVNTHILKFKTSVVSIMSMSLEHLKIK